MTTAVIETEGLALRPNGSINTDVLSADFAGLLLPAGHLLRSYDKPPTKVRLGSWIQPVIPKGSAIELRYGTLVRTACLWRHYSGFTFDLGALP